MDFFRRLTGTFFEPGKTFSGLAEKPVWVDALIVLLIGIILFSYLAFPYGQKDSLKLFEDNEAKLKAKWGEERYAQAIERTKGAPRWLTAGVIVPVTSLIGLLFSSLILLGLGRLFSTQGSYLQVFSMLIHANFVDKFLGNAVRLFLIVTRQSVVATSTGLAIFFPSLETTSGAYLILNQVDFFQLWLFGVFGLGLSFAFKLSLKKGLVLSYLFWTLKTLLAIGIGLLQLRAFQ